MRLSTHVSHKRLARLRHDQRGVAMIEFALGAPLLVIAGLWGVELTNLAIANQRVSQIALELADNASRVGLYSGQGTLQLREVDVNDVLEAVRARGDQIDLGRRGRVILSSLEHNGTDQRIHWQRCFGERRGTGYDSSYGTTSITAGTSTNSNDAGTLTPNGMGEAGSRVHAPSNSGVMFVEINYEYKPLIGNGWFTSPKRLHYTASFIVRDNRDFAQIYNPAPAATRATCNLYAS